MFSFFKRKTTPDTLMKALKPCYFNTVALVTKIDGPFVDLFEAGIFVGIAANIKLLTSSGPDNAEKITAEFNKKWIDYLSSSYTINGNPPSDSLILSRFQAKFQIYSKMILELFTEKDEKIRRDNLIQLMWELFSNCTGKKSPEGEGGFLKLVIISGDLTFIISDIFKVFEK